MKKQTMFGHPGNEVSAVLQIIRISLAEKARPLVEASQPPPVLLLLWDQLVFMQALATTIAMLFEADSSELCLYSSRPSRSQPAATSHGNRQLMGTARSQPRWGQAP